MQASTSQTEQRKLVRRGKYRFEQFTAIRRNLGLDFSPDGSEIAYITNTSGQFNIWRLPVSGGWPTQMTVFEEETVRTLGWSPNGEEIFFSADRHGDEFHQLYRLSIDGGWPEALTNKPKVQHHFHSECIAPDGRKLAYFCNDRAPTDMDVTIRELRSGETRTLLAGNAFYAFASWSPNGKHAVCLDVKSNTDQNIYLCDPQTGASKLLTPHEGEAVFFAGPWSPDNSGFYFVSDYGREFKGVAFYDLASKSYDWVETPKWDVEDGAISEDGRIFAWTTNEDGYSHLHLENRKTGKPLRKPKLPSGAVTNLKFSPDGRFLAFYHAGPNHVSDLYLLDLKSMKIRRLTHSMIGGIDEKDLVDPKVVHFSSFDGRKIPGFLYKPKGLMAGERVPAVLSIHGGPEAQERPVYSYAGFYQYLLDRGIGVFAPNIRGSLGFGKTYQKLIHRDFGGGDLKDMEAAAEYLRTLDWVDQSRVAVFGGSYGGFACLSCVTRLPEYWAAAVDIVGPSNLVTFVKSVPPHWRRFMKLWVGDPEEDREMLRQRSPITYVHQVKTPLLIIQGANDPRVVKAGSDQIVENLRSRGIPVEYMVFEDEGHGFTKRKNEIKAWRASAEFLVERLVGSEAK